jgi:hypothetical protein
VLLGCFLGGAQEAPKEHPRDTQGANGIRIGVHSIVMKINPKLSKFKISLDLISRYLNMALNLLRR